MDWLPLRVLKPKITAAELSRYLLGTCGKVIIAQGYRSEKIYLCHGCNLLLLNWYLFGVEMNLGHAHKTRFWYLLGVPVFSKFSDEHPRLYHRVLNVTHPPIFGT